MERILDLYMKIPVWVEKDTDFSYQIRTDSLNLTLETCLFILNRKSNIASRYEIALVYGTETMCSLSGSRTGFSLEEDFLVFSGEGEEEGLDFRL